MQASQANSDVQSVSVWRAHIRRELVTRRLATPDDVHARWSAAIDQHLDRLLGYPGRFKVIGFCWPYKREFDARPLVARLLRDGVRAALPVVVAPHAPLEFRQWHPDAPMEAGAYGIPVPRKTVDAAPDVLLLPANGFDSCGYRLGYGGGYFDRTLSSMSPRPVAIGVSFELGRLPTIRPEAHDVPLDCIVTEAGAFRTPPI
jgi:5,10-methenyltetrahydrofolate synthetase